MLTRGGLLWARGDRSSQIFDSDTVAAKQNARRQCADQTDDEAREKLLFQGAVVIGHQECAYSQHSANCRGHTKQNYNYPNHVTTSNELLGTYFSK